MLTSVRFGIFRVLVAARHMSLNTSIVGKVYKQSSRTPANRDTKFNSKWFLAMLKIL